MHKTEGSWLISWPLALSSGGILVALAATVWLWTRYGTAVFFETIRAGFIACFG
jgi:hypothetical protein